VGEGNSGLARPPVRNGIYTTIEGEPFTVYNDHPSMLMPPGRAARNAVDRRLDHAFDTRDVLARWNWDTTWGWDYPVIAMTAARLGEPEKAVDALLMDSPKNQYLREDRTWEPRAGCRFTCRGTAACYMRSR